MISVEEYRRLKRRDRQVLGIEDFTDADIATVRDQYRRTVESAQAEENHAPNSVIEQ